MTTDGLVTSLATIEKALAELGRDELLRVLQPGIPADATRAALEEIGLRSTAEIEALYAWHDGIAPSEATIGEISLWPGQYFSSLEGAAANYRAFVDDARWTPGWLPVFPDGGGDFYVVDVSTPGRAPVRHFWIDDVEHPVEFLSLTSMFATLAEAYRRGYFFVSAEGYLTRDTPAFAQLAAEMNPDVEFWRT